MISKWIDLQFDPLFKELEIHFKLQIVHVAVIYQCVYSKVDLNWPFYHMFPSPRAL